LLDEGFSPTVETVRRAQGPDELLSMELRTQASGESVILDTDATDESPSSNVLMYASWWEVVAMAWRKTLVLTLSLTDSSTSKPIINSKSYLYTTD